MAKKSKKPLEPHEAKFVLHGMLKTVTRIKKETIADIEVARQANIVTIELSRLINMIGG